MASFARRSMAPPLPLAQIISEAKTNAFLAEGNLCHLPSNLSCAHSLCAVFVSLSTRSFLLLATELVDIEDLVDGQAKAIVSLIHRVAVERGIHQYIDPPTGYTVFTSAFLAKRPCCGSGCRHCPYGHINVKKQKTR